MSYEMRALTVWQPWASLLGTPVRWTKKGQTIYSKRYETRTWATDYRGTIAIHAAARPIHECVRDIRLSSSDMQMLVQALLPIIQLDGSPAGIDWRDVAMDLEHYLSALPRRQIICIGELTDCVLITPEFRARQKPRELALGNWEIGNYAWKIDKRRPIPPVTVNGAQGLWRWR